MCKWVKSRFIQLPGIQRVVAPVPGEQARQCIRPYRVYHFLNYGLVVRFRLLPTPPLGDAVSFSYGQPVFCPMGTSTPLLVRTFRRTKRRLQPLPPPRKRRLQPLPPPQPLPLSQVSKGKGKGWSLRLRRQTPHQCAEAEAQTSPRIFPHLPTSRRTLDCGFYLMESDFQAFQIDELKSRIGELRRYL